MESSNKPGLDIYLYGMTVYSTIHLLDGDYPAADTYGEIKETHNVPGGETGNSALILANLGYNVKIDGPFLGTRTRDGILDFYEKFKIDCSGMPYDTSFDGVLDMVLIDSHSRTVFGKFGHYFSGPKRWTQPDKAAMAAARIVGMDPFFGEESEQVAAYCAEIGKPYVTIDCRPDSFMHQHAAAIAVSNEFIRNTFPEEEIESLFHRYTETTDGLVIFTFGAREILYGRKGGPIQRLTPFKVEVKSTLGAGDTFRAGVIHGVLNGMDDTGIVKFAAATAASVCRRFPMALDPPGLEEIRALAEGR